MDHIIWYNTSGVSVLDIRTRSEDKLYLFLSSVRSHLEHAAGSTPKKIESPTERQISI